MYHKFFEELAFTDKQKLDIQQAAKQADKRSLTLELERAIKLRDVQKVGTILLQGFQTFGPVCPLVLIQSCYEQVCNLYRDLCIEESVRVATLSDISLWTQAYAHDHSQETGFAQVFWIARHVCAKILRLGRLQFEQKSMNSPLRIYQQERSEQCITLAEADIA
ncbi:acyltransferase domain-containing protein, partial [Sphaerochaeta sp.]|uniref:acyltransferase domain-containing protein n=1 Tax=Sphaerochaeta sp. TaxID=1972642 RepID=UPI002582F02B